MSAAVLLCLALVTASPAPVGPSRAAYQQAQQALEQAHAAVVAQEGQLRVLADAIAAEKLRRSTSPSLFVPATLEAELAESQRQADALVQARAQEALRQGELQRSREALYQALNQEIAAREPSARGAAALQALQALQAERAAVAPASSAQVPAPSFQGGTDDPRELHERADALRDQADKLARQEAALDARIQAARQQAKLEKQLRRLAGSEGLFDEADRRVRVTRSEPAGATMAADRTAGGPGHGSSTPPTASPTIATTTRLPTVDQPAPTSMTGNQGPGLSPPPSGGLAASPPPRTDSPAPAVAAPTTEQTGHISGEVVRAEELQTRPDPLDDGEDALPALLRAKSQVAQRRQALESQARQLDAQGAGQSSGR